jgi:hypothetical protein
MGTDRRQRILLIAAAAVVALLLGDRFVITPLAGVWKVWGEKIQTDSDKLAKFSPKRAEDMQTRWGEMKQRSLPRELPVAEGQVLGAVSKWAGSSRLAVSSVKPHWSGDDKEAKSKTVEFRVMATGTLSSIAGFLYALETDPMPLRVEDIEMTTKDPKGAQITLSLHFTGLVLLEEKS